MQDVLINQDFRPIEVYVEHLETDMFEILTVELPLVE